MMMKKVLQVMMESAKLNVQKDKRESGSFKSLEKKACMERSSKRMAFRISSAQRELF